MNEPKPQAEPESVGSRYLREHIGPCLDYVSMHHKPLTITRNSRPSVVMIPADWRYCPPADTGETHPSDLPAHNGQ